MAFPDPSTVTGFNNLLPYINTVMDNAFGMVFLFALYTIFFLSLKEYPTNQALASASFITFPFAVFFYAIGLINIYFVVLFVILTIVFYVMIKE